MSSVHKITINDIENNVYYLNNRHYFLELVKLVETYPKTFGTKLKDDIKSKNYILYHKLVVWINTQLPILNVASFKYSYATKCYWIFNNLIDFPICPICHKSDNYKNKNISISKGYSYCCCKKCTYDNPKRSQKISNTQHKHAQENPNYWSNRYEKSKITCNKNYGVDNPSQSPIILQKKSDTVFKNFGVRHNFQAKEVLEERKQTWLNNYGVEHISLSDYYKKQFKETSLDRFGTEHPMHNSEIRKKCHQKYIFNNIYFDSSWEVALYIYLSDNNILFEYLPQSPKLYYKINGIQHRYFPDFKIDGKLVEIKGDHLIDDNGNWIPPPAYKSMVSELEYEQMCNQVKSKLLCATENNVKILTSINCKKYLKYVEDKYGKNFLKSLKIKMKC